MILCGFYVTHIIISLLSSSKHIVCRLLLKCNNKKKTADDLSRRIFFEGFFNTFWKPKQNKHGRIHAKIYILCFNLKSHFGRYINHFDMWVRGWKNKKLSHQKQATSQGFFVPGEITVEFQFAPKAHHLWW